MAPVDEAIVDVLDTAVAALTKTTNLFFSPMRPDDDYLPATCVFVLLTGGPEPERYSDGGAGTRLSRPALQVTVRFDQGDYDGGRDLAKLVWAALDRSSPADCLPNSFRCRESEPAYLGKDDGGRHLWTINVLGYKQE